MVDAEINEALIRRRVLKRLDRSARAVNKDASTATVVHSGEIDEECEEDEFDFEERIQPLLRVGRDGKLRRMRRNELCRMISTQHYRRWLRKHERMAYRGRKPCAWTTRFRVQRYLENQVRKWSSCKRYSLPSVPQVWRCSVPSESRRMPPPHRYFSRELCYILRRMDLYEEIQVNTCADCEELRGPCRSCLWFWIPQLSHSNPRCRSPNPEPLPQIILHCSGQKRKQLLPLSWNTFVPVSFTIVLKSCHVRSRSWYISQNLILPVKYNGYPINWIRESTCTSPTAASGVYSKFCLALESAPTSTHIVDLLLAEYHLQYQCNPRSDPTFHRTLVDLECIDPVASESYDGTLTESPTLHRTLVDLEWIYPVASESYDGTLTESPTLHRTLVDLECIDPFSPNHVVSQLMEHWLNLHLVIYRRPDESMHYLRCNHLLPSYRSA